MKQANRILSLLLALVMIVGLIPQAMFGTVFAVDPDDKYPNGITDISETIESNGYIDLPVEILDFRGDGFLFEASSCWDNPYSLSYNSENSITVNMTDEAFLANIQEYGGALTNGETLTKVSPTPFVKEGNGKLTRITGLVQDELVDGKLLYTEDTLIYIAYALYNKYEFANSISNFIDKYSVDGTSENDTVWINGEFYKTAKDGLPLGSPEDTYKKFSEKSLIWDNVETTFDLAHYMLSYVWNPVLEDDYLDSITIGDQEVEGRYNLPVPEINKLRLYKTQNSEGNEYYTIDTKYFEGYKDGRIYIANNSKEETGGERGDSWANPTPCFRPIENLGFEQYFINEDGTPKQKHKINTTGGWNGQMDYTNTNYLFTLHASGGFVYNEESEYFFEFRGDDDVYFFINKELVVDIGGIHESVEVKCMLNDYAESHGLKDGQICSFDMYFADRHTTGVNMLLSTNIELMDYDLLTQKKQFDARTGLEYPNGQAVPYGTSLDYQFSILNRKSLPASNVSFTDENLGVELDTDTIKLSNSTEYLPVDGGRTDISAEGIEVFYRPYNEDGALVTENMETLGSFGALYEAIAPFTETITLPEGEPPRIQTAYRYKVQTAEELADILSMGVPGYCEFAVYGIERTLQKADSAGGDRVVVANEAGIYSNTLRSSACPVRSEKRAVK